MIVACLALAAGVARAQTAEPTVSTARAPTAVPSTTLANVSTPEPSPRPSTDDPRPTYYPFCEESACLILNNGFYGGFFEKDKSCCAEVELGACMEGYRYSKGPSCGKGQTECQAHKTCCTKCERGLDDDECRRYDEEKFGKNIDCTPTWKRFVGIYVALGIFVACFPCLCFFLFQKRRAHIAAEDAERSAHVELADASPAEFAAAAVVDEGDGATPEVHAVAVDEVKAVLRPSSGPSFWEPERRPSAYAAAAPEDDDASTII